MMMAHDSSPTPPGGLAEPTILSVQAALRAYVEQPHTEGETLRNALHAMAAEARDKSMLPEQLLVVLKDIWYALPSVRGTGEPADQIRLLQRVVTMCIKEYYGD
jgi:hypothetical protein